MATIASFRDEVDLYVKRASTDTTFLDDQILKVIRDFCTKTWLWRITLDPINVVQDQPDYTLTIPDTEGDAELHFVDWVKYKEDGADDDQWGWVYPVVLDDNEQPGQTYWGPNETEDSPGPSPLKFWVDPRGTLYLNPTPDSTAAGTENLKVKVIVRPIIGTTTEVPDFFYSDWVETIAKGVAGRILNMASKKWYDPALSDRYTKQYSEARDYEAKVQRWRGKNRTKIFARVHSAFSGGSRHRGTTQFF